jgi:hypothetical protein
MTAIRALGDSRGDGRLVVDRGPLGGDPGIALVDDRRGLGLPLGSVGDPGPGIGGGEVRVVERAVHLSPPPEPLETISKMPEPPCKPSSVPRVAPRRRTFL